MASRGVSPREQSGEATSLSEPGSVSQVHLAGRLLRWRQSAQVSSGRSGRRAGLRSRAGVGGDAGKAEIWGKLVRETLGGPADTAEQPAALGEVGETGGGGGRY